MTNPEKAPHDAESPKRERRVINRDATITPPHVAEDLSNPEPIPPIAPHMAEPEPVTHAEIVTVNSSRGKTTIVVERVPGQATHATVIEENQQPKESKGVRKKRKRDTRAAIEAPLKPDAPG